MPAEFAGAVRVAGLIALGSGRPHLLLDAAPEQTPWLSLAKFNESGGVVVCMSAASTSLSTGTWIVMRSSLTLAARSSQDVHAGANAKANELDSKLSNSSAVQLPPPPGRATVGPGADSGHAHGCSKASYLS